MFDLGIAAAWMTLAEYAQLKLVMDCGCRLDWAPDRAVDWYLPCAYHGEVQIMVRSRAAELRALL